LLKAGCVSRCGHGVFPAISDIEQCVASTGALPHNEAEKTVFGYDKSAVLAQAEQLEVSAHRSRIHRIDEHVHESTGDRVYQKYQELRHVKLWSVT
jgi:hypothetical protein